MDFLDLIREVIGPRGVWTCVAQRFAGFDSRLLLANVPVQTTAIVAHEMHIEWLVVWLGMPGAYHLIEHWRLIVTVVVLADPSNPQTT